MNLILFICMLFALQLAYWVIGRRSSKNIQGSEDYFLAGKSVRFFPLMMTFVGVIVGGGVVLGAVEEAYLYGWPVFLYPLGGALGLIALGLGIGSRLAQFQVTTTAQIFEVVYKSSALKKAASCLSILSLFMVLVGQIIASQKFLVSLGLDSALIFIVFWVIVVVYTSQGGLKAVISTDIAQASLFIFVFLGATAYTMINNPVQPMAPVLEWAPFEPVSTKLAGWLLMPLFFMVIEQDIGQRCFAGSSPKVVSKAALAAGICVLILCIVPIYFGTLAQTMGLKVPSGGSVLMSAVSATLPETFAALVGCAILAAIISTATALMNAISSNISSDFEIERFKTAAGVRLMRLLTAGISFSAIAVASFFDNIVDMLIQSYELSVSCMFVPVLAALFKRNGNFISGALAFLCGSLGFVLFRVYPIDFPREIASLFLSVLGYGAGELIAYLKKERESSQIIQNIL